MKYLFVRGQKKKSLNLEKSSARSQLLLIFNLIWTAIRKALLPNPIFMWPVSSSFWAPHKDVGKTLPYTFYN